MLLSCLIRHSYLFLQVEREKIRKKRKRRKEKDKDFDQDFQFSGSDDEGHVNGWNLEETVAHLRKEAVVSFCNLFPVNSFYKNK